jgi:hypothetical protein
MSELVIFNPFLPLWRSLKNVYFIQAECFTFPLEVIENHLTACKIIAAFLNMLKDRLSGRFVSLIY